MNEYLFCECCNCVTDHKVTREHGLTVKRCRECGAEYSERSREYHDHKRREQERERRLPGW